MNVLLNSFHLNGHTLGVYPQTKKLHYTNWDKISSWRKGINIITIIINSNKRIHSFMTKLFCSWCCHFLSKFPSCGWNTTKRVHKKTSQASERLGTNLYFKTQKQLGAITGVPVNESHFQSVCSLWHRKVKTASERLNRTKGKQWMISEFMIDE